MLNSDYMLNSNKYGVFSVLPTVVAFTRGSSTVGLNQGVLLQNMG